MAKGKQITPSQGTSKTPQTSAPPPIARPQSDRTNLARTGAAIPKTDVIAESGWSAVEMVPAAPARNTPVAALTEAERAIPVVPPPQVPPGKK